MPLEELLKILPSEMFEKDDTGKESPSVVEADENTVSCLLLA